METAPHTDLRRHPESNRAAAEPLMRLEADFAETGCFGHRVLEVTSESVRVRDGDGAVSFLIPIAEIKSARNEPLVGGGRLEITTATGEIVPVLTYSLTVAARFSEAARGIEQLAKGEPLAITLKQEQTRCAKCNRLLPEKDGICPACINRNKTLLRIAGYLKPYRKQALWLAGISVLQTALNLAPPLIQGSLVDGVLTAHRHIGLLFGLMALWLATLVVRTGADVKSGWLISYLAGYIAADLRAGLYRAIEFLPLTFFDKKQIGAIASRVNQDTDRVWGFLVEGVPFFLTNALQLLGVVIFLFRTSWQLTLCILSPIPVVVAISGIFWKPVSQLYHRFGQKWARFQIHLNESLSGIRVVKAFAQEDFENKKFLDRNRELREAGVRADSHWHTIFGAMMFFTGLGTLINWTVGGYMVYAHQMTLGAFWKVNALLALVYGPLQWFAMINSWFSRAMAGAERVFEVMDTDPEQYDDSHPSHDIQGEVTFENVRFGYDKSNPVLKGLSFTARPGDMIGLVGKSGAGKSTTINLICRFYEPDAGSIRIDGADYRDISLQELRRQIGIVLQEPFLFNGTIAENIAYGKPDASFEEVVTAARAANAHNFILSKPDGYDTMVGERGAKLSGGERQRISIARAILHDPKILILDEATSSVDVETEKQIQEAIGRLIEGRTTFAIAHRLSTLRNATRLIVLEKGEIAEMGTHAELMEKKGVFCNLVETQSQINEIIGLG
ncbi:MAG TPA: ABC transporter ATP-binding protein [Chthonomonadaceae bacterium]|nr:ABC transporter ATP-binding protein [Chthonomonadaceae bacterium]